MKPNKEDFQITQFDKEHFRVSIRKPFLCIFNRWVELTHIDNGEEVPMEYKSFNECKEFINYITE